MKWVRLGDYIEQCDEVNSENREYPIMGVNRDKKFMPTVANISESNRNKYKIVKNGIFAMNGLHVGRDECIPVALYLGEEIIAVSPAYTTFRVSKAEKLLPEFLFIYFMRTEMDRYAGFICDSSIRGNLVWERFSDIKIPLPDIDEQRVVVDAWLGLKNLKEENEKLAEPLLSLCKSYIQDLKKNYPSVEIGDYITSFEQTNIEDEKYPVIGINKDKEFMPTVANVSFVDIRKYKIVKNGVFVFSGMQTGRDECIRIGLYDLDNISIISPAYTTFKITDTESLLPEFLFLCFKHEEMDRYGWFISDSSVRANLDWNRFLDIKIPLPPIKIQKLIVEIYKCAKECKQIAVDAEKQINDIAPSLMRHVIGA